MLFEHSPRFREVKSEPSAGFIDSKSQLSSTGTKIVDSWYSNPSGERFDPNYIVKNGSMIPIRNESPEDKFKYSPRVDVVKPRPPCMQWSKSTTKRFGGTESVESSPLVKLKGDFDGDYPQTVKTFGSARRDLSFPSADSLDSKMVRGEGMPYGEAVFEEPSFSSRTCYNMEVGGSWLSSEAADRSYALTSERSVGFTIGVRHPDPVPTVSPGPGHYSPADIPAPGQGVSIKSRYPANAAVDKTNPPGPGAYYSLESNSLVRKSHNKAAQKAAAAKASRDLFVPPGRPPVTHTASHHKAPGRHRLIFEASSLAENSAINHHQPDASDREVVPGGHKQHSRNRKAEAVQIARKSGRPAPRVDAINAHVSHDDIRSVRNMFNGILKKTDSILSHLPPIDDRHRGSSEAMTNSLFKLM
mmetsp:Transcript_9250/g.13930  ORF Transcript_9250/g.13930 Transcript_9250/m.13930 type:complete len:415 (-) Transcript_9250:162-1406(-)|eukprot:CAMPEP_0185037286 /NCGR_PEP_ID=MMETSP1103-20130426/31453_1 /TAXON_ID=36769 /ORGANISM="Paraphysomonas bandaiensis, Strain Caron Lab Isolate" /LENGTH=414 /DNA_ID=CAMNT_0027575193 /DNA_START=222 /DNA_END=1466 /DNA_ORIENTATION=-